MNDKTYCIICEEEVGTQPLCPECAGSHALPSSTGSRILSFEVNTRDEFSFKDLDGVEINGVLFTRG